MTDNKINLTRPQVLAITAGLLLMFLVLVDFFSYLISLHFSGLPVFANLVEGVAYNLYSKILTIAVVLTAAACYYYLKDCYPDCSRKGKHWYVPYLLSILLGLLLFFIIESAVSFSIGTEANSLYQDFVFSMVFVLLLVTGFSAIAVDIFFNNWDD